MLTTQLIVLYSVTCVTIDVLYTTMCLCTFYTHNNWLLSISSRTSTSIALLYSVCHMYQRDVVKTFEQTTKLSLVVYTSISDVDYLYMCGIE